VRLACRRPHAPRRSHATDCACVFRVCCAFQPTEERRKVRAAHTVPSFRAVLSSSRRLSGVGAAPGGVQEGAAGGGSEAARVASTAQGCCSAAKGTVRERSAPRSRFLTPTTLSHNRAFVVCVVGVMAACGGCGPKDSSVRVLQAGHVRQGASLLSILRSQAQSIVSRCRVLMCLHFTGGAVRHGPRTRRVMQGTKCKFSHDLTMGSKGRLDLHRDLRDVRAEESSEAKEGGERATAASLPCRCCLTLRRFVCVDAVSPSVASSRVLRFVTCRCCPAFTLSLA
jgi:hypothetical protein